MVQVEFKRNHFFPSHLHIHLLNVYRLYVRSQLSETFKPLTTDSKDIATQVFIKQGGSALVRKS